MSAWVVAERMGVDEAYRELACPRRRIACTGTARKKQALRRQRVQRHHVPRQKGAQAIMPECGRSSPKATATRKVGPERRETRSEQLSARSRAAMLQYERGAASKHDRRAALRGRNELQQAWPCREASVGRIFGRAGSEPRPSTYGPPGQAGQAKQRVSRDGAIDRAVGTRDPINACAFGKL